MRHLLSWGLVLLVVVGLLAALSLGWGLELQAAGLLADGALPPHIPTPLGEGVTLV